MNGFGPQNCDDFTEVSLQPLEGFDLVDLDGLNGAASLPGQIWPAEESSLPNQLPNGTWTFPAEN